MISTSTLATRGMAATAFADAVKWVRVPDARDAAIQAYVPSMPATPTFPVDGGVTAERKRGSDNQRVSMILTGAVGAGASGPSPWRCPV